MINKKDIYKIGIAVVVAFAVFQAGVFVGLHQARFMNHFGDNYMKNIPGGHGAIGKVISVASSTLVVSDANVEKIVTITPETKIAKHRDTATTTDIKVGDMIVVIGEPDESGKVNARFIRLMPPLPYAKN
jgi:hypothetical protein